MYSCKLDYDVGTDIIGSSVVHLHPLCPYAIPPCIVPSIPLRSPAYACWTGQTGDYHPHCFTAAPACPLCLLAFTNSTMSEFPRTSPPLNSPSRLPPSLPLELRGSGSRTVYNIMCAQLWQRTGSSALLCFATRI